MNINLARKWRSKNFDQIVGQDLPVKMLKNSLYLDQFFPVYLFSGQRGCGKTSAARIFAAAANCIMLPDFQRAPKLHAVPCLTCPSCQAMAHGNHPDFIEVDAASHTGVDNVRNIIEAATLLPVLGRKRIYLIDEAHMLSKAAFNAFLKLLEEPPASVFFMLATTDPQKIIDTVTSRCFQLFFKAINPRLLADHLAYICAQENIDYQPEGLLRISERSAGSVRDAINLLEQVRFVGEGISERIVFQVLGAVDEEYVLQILDATLNKPAQELLDYLQTLSIQQTMVQAIWLACVRCVRDMVFVKHNAVTQKDAYYERLRTLSAAHTVDSLYTYMCILYDHEELLAKTMARDHMLVYILLQINSLSHKNLNKPSQFARVDSSEQIVQSSQPRTTQQQPVIKENMHDNDKRWIEFLTAVGRLNDPVLISIFRQAKVAIKNAADGVLVNIVFAEKLTLFHDLLENTKKTWLPIMQTVFGADLQFNVSFDAAVQNSVMSASVKNVEPPSTVAQTLKKPMQQTSYKSVSSESNDKKKSISVTPSRERIIDVTDKERWKKTHTILAVFPGRVTECIEDTNA